MKMSREKKKKSASREGETIEEGFTAEGFTVGGVISGEALWGLDMSEHADRAALGFQVSPPRASGGGGGHVERTGGLGIKIDVVVVVVLLHVFVPRHGGVLLLMDVAGHDRDR